MPSETLQNPLGRLLQFLDDLEEKGLYYELKHVRESLMVSVYIPAGIWEIEFFEDGNIEVEFFKRHESVKSVTESWLDEFITENSD